MKKNQIVGLGVVAALLVLYLGAQIFASKKAEEKAEEIRQEMKPFVELDYEDADFGLLSQDITVSEITLAPAGSGEKVQIDELVIHDFDDESKFPSFLSLEINGLEVRVEDMDAEAAETFRAMGYEDKLMVNFKLDYTFDQKKKILDIEKIAIEGDDIGELTASFQLEIIDLYTSQVNLHEAELEYEDDSLVDRLIKAYAKERGMTFKNAKFRMEKQFDEEIAREKDEFTKKAMIELKEFILDPDEIKITASPEKPQPLARVMNIENMSDYAKLFNLKIKR
ncbi:MAG: hypothetical protein CSB24_00415 [Deltaproteobacteria bacterium]|nr:MAG: hypothetical protein CSB24_00415 [Deltaproteobacteria bacterium]